MTLQGRGRGGGGVTNECRLGVTEKMSLQLCIIFLDFSGVISGQKKWIESNFEDKLLHTMSSLSILLQLLNLQYRGCMIIVVASFPDRPHVRGRFGNWNATRLEGEE